MYGNLEAAGEPNKHQLSDIAMTHFASARHYPGIPLLCRARKEEGGQLAASADHPRLVTYGRLAYDLPPIAAQKPYIKRSLVATLPRDDLDLLYQWFIQREFGQAMRLNRPMFGTHVTIVRHDEAVPNMAPWGKYEGLEVEIEYDVVVRRHFAFWSLPVYNDWFQEIRRELGLPPAPDFHITIGRQFAWQPVPVSARRTAHSLRMERAAAEAAARRQRG
ncbi:hypothetical protein SAMN06265795_117121 [Noviherbaspirillum humi]|uniref:Uncharacterized protein n=1 Tax=Noviherbaspirillum humi TaxID=1688639 RepID=A0A239KXI1_9BURK|nr:hypothetical protein [Noviherbaspirillum humi]SNT22209.1 hypothetical protein SAMN06265795_117121 [Noviherbaspirillum humi]